MKRTYEFTKKLSIAMLLLAVSALQAAAQQSLPKVVVTTPPDSLKLDTTFYKKYMNVNGLAVCSSARVPDSCFQVAYITFEAVTRMLSPEVMQSMVSHGARVTIMSKDEQTCDVPEHAHLADDPNTDWNKRARGLGGTLWLPMNSCAEENIMHYRNDRYYTEDITIHEFAHTIHNVGIAPVYPEFNKELRACFEKAKSEGKWENTYAGSNVGEYWAEGVQDWFDVNIETEKPNGIHNRVNTREELRTYDPGLYELLSRYFPNTDEHPSRHPYQNRYVQE